MEEGIGAMMIGALIAVGGITVFYLIAGGIKLWQWLTILNCY